MVWFAFTDCVFSSGSPKPNVADPALHDAVSLVPMTNEPSRDLDDVAAGDLGPRRPDAAHTIAPDVEAAGRASAHLQAVADPLGQAHRQHRVAGDGRAWTERGQQLELNIGQRVVVRDRQ